jgi:hypothetical protein
VRAYLPVTLTSLARVIEAGQLEGPDLTGYGVTPSLREWYAEGDTEELEYVALSHAARASLRLLAVDADAPRRRVVLAADVPDGDVHALHGADAAAVLIATAVPLRYVVSAHVDDVEAATDVAAAVAALDAADAGDDNAQFIIDSVEDHELQWFAAQEFASLVQT